MIESNFFLYLALLSVYMLSPCVSQIVDKNRLQPTMKLFWRGALKLRDGIVGFEKRILNKIGRGFFGKQW